MSYHGSSRTLTFGGPADADPVLADPVRPVSGRSAAKRAKHRRRAAQRRLRVRKRDGSEPLLAFLIVIGLTLMLVDVLSGGSAYGGARWAVGSLVAPLQAGVAQAVDPQQADAVLTAEGQPMPTPVTAEAADAPRLRELEGLFGLVSRSNHKVVAASIVALDSSSGTPRSAVIDQGTAAGIEVDQAVLSGSGLLGRVESATESSAVVRMVTDPTFVAGVRMAPSGEAGILRGTGGSQDLTVEVLNPIAAINKGDAVATFGSPGDRPFPPGIPVGTVDDAGESSQPHRTLTVKPAGQVTATSVVAVVVGPSESAPAAPVDPATLAPAPPVDPATLAPAPPALDVP